MEVKDLKPKLGKVEITLEITEKGEAKEFSKFGSVGRVCNAKGKDSTGEIAVTLWNEQVDQVNEGDVIKITNGYVSEYQGEMQLSTGKFGQLEVVGKGKEAEAPKKEKKPKDEEITKDEKEETKILESAKKTESEEPLEEPEETELEPEEEMVE
jgi:replication factor A1